ncbi:MAG: dihydropteroate synthase [Campylobacterales bacterium]|nr:dihydropteroate synthase [Campylobacterales bacterium]
MKIYRVDISDKKEFLKKLNVDSGGISIIADKMELYHIYIKDIKTPAVNILKQDALSVGAEVAAPKSVITCENEYSECLLIGTKKHLKRLSRKCATQPFGLKEVAKSLETYIQEKHFNTKIMGVLNINEDSFYSGSRVGSEEAIEVIKHLIDEGAAIVDIGAVSSRPNATKVSDKEEFERVVELLDEIDDKRLYERAVFSIDSYTPSVVEHALKSGFGIINDITGASDDALIELAIKYKAKLCIMHMQGTPQDMQKNPHYDDVMSEVSDFFEARIAKCEALGLSREDIILDVGIGFGKSLEHNLTLLVNLSHFKKFGCQLLIGASRKSIIDAIYPSSVEQRLPGTLAIHLKALQNGANIIRCHDVAEHRQALDVWELIKE